MQVSDLKCNCVTTTIAKSYLEGKAELKDVRRALEEHWNHACSDFIYVYELYLEERRKERLEHKCEVSE